MSFPSLTNFLFDRRAKNSKTPFTHTRIGDKELNIYAGSYSIPDEELKSFYETYYQEVFNCNRNEYLTERQLDKAGCMAVDFDFRYDHSIDTRQHTEEHISDMVCDYGIAIKEFYKIKEDDTFKVYIFEKPNVNRLEDGSLTKDGIHMIIGLKVDYEIQLQIRDQMMDTLKDSWKDLPLTNDFDSVLDKGISTGKTNWQLFGSKKPNNQAYCLTHIYSLRMETDDGDFITDEENVDTFDLEENFEKLSVRYRNNPKFELKKQKQKDIGNVPDNNARRNKKIVIEEETDEETDEETEDKTGKNNKYNEIKECAEIISESRYLKSGKYTEWINIIWALRSMNNEDYKQIAYDLAKRCNRDAEKYVDVYWDNYNATKNVTIASLFYYAKESDEKEFYKIKNKYAVEKYFDFITIENMIQTASESDFADIFYKQFKNNMVLDGDNLYLYYDNEWRVEKESKPHILINMIDKWCKEYIKRCYVLVGKSKAEFVDDEEMIKFLNKFDKNIAKMNLGCKKVNFCKNVATFLKSKMSVIFDKKPFDIGEQDHYNINFKNGVYDMKNKIFRERCYYDYITKWLDYDYIESEKISDEIHNDVLDFFKKIQPDKEQRDFTIGFLSYCLTGNIDKQKFKMNIGYSAQNGKSTELGIHDKCFPIYTKKLNRETFDTGYTKRHKHIIDILNNPIRLAYVEELSERKMDTEFIKDFVDAKKISCEVMFGTDETKKIQAKMMTVGNSDFNAKTDEGLKRRGLIQHYTSKFVEKGEFSEENHIYKRIDGFENRFADDKYKNAYFHLLLKYTDNLIIPKVNEDAFKEVCDDNDHFKNTLFDAYELTGDPNHAVYWKDICVLFGSTPAKANRKNISNEMKRLNLVYDKDKFCNGKGCYLGLKLLELVEETNH